MLVLDLMILFALQKVYQVNLYFIKHPYLLL